MITIEQVLDAYNETGLNPIRHAYKRDTIDSTGNITFQLNGVCPLSALYCKDNGLKKLSCYNDDFAEEVFHWAIHRFGESYVYGFIDGLDYGGFYHNNDGTYNIGHKDGEEIRKQLFA